MKYTVFDVETPNGESDRMSAIGITIIEDEKITDEFYSLVNPETYFDYFNTRLTGIDEDLVREEPNFAEIWKKIEPYMNNSILVAHNAPFDLGVLKRCLFSYEIEWKPYVHYICTARVGRKHLPKMRHRLNDLCDYYGIYLNHHNAQSDSRAAAEILLRYAAEGVNLKDFIRTYKFY